MKRRNKMNDLDIKVLIECKFVECLYNNKNGRCKINVPEYRETTDEPC